MIKVNVHVGTQRQALEVHAPRARIGRVPECEIQLPGDVTVSRVHAVLEEHADGLVLTDAGSRNGTHLNGMRVTEPVRVAPADRIRVGPFVLVVQTVEDAYLETADAASVGEARLQIETGLTPRELEVLRLVAAGHSDQQIAESLFLSIKTVQSHLDRMRDKTGCRRRPELLRFAIDHGVA